MKRPVIFLQFFLFLGITLMTASPARSQNSSLEINLKNNEQIKNEVFKIILNDRILFNELMDEMARNQHSVNWIINHPRIRKELYNQDHLKKMMTIDPERQKELLNGVMDMIKQDTSVYNQINLIMQQHPLNARQFQ